MAIMWIETDENKTLNFIQNNLEKQQLTVLSLDFLLQTNAKLLFFLSPSSFICIDRVLCRCCFFFVRAGKLAIDSSRLNFIKLFAKCLHEYIYFLFHEYLLWIFFSSSSRSTKKRLIERWSQTEREETLWIRKKQCNWNR